MRIRIIDAFTDQPFRGNPAAVCLLEDTWPDEDWMRQVAAEMNLSETAFAHPVDDGDADYALRWFTPEVETDLCGHATLATAHALHQDRGTPATVRFTTRSGILVAHSFDDGRITLDLSLIQRVHWAICWWCCPMRTLCGACGRIWRRSRGSSRSPAFVA